MGLVALLACGGVVVTDQSDRAADDTGVADTADSIDSAGDLGPLTVFVNEFMPANVAALEGQAANFPDWIELYNGGSSPLDLSGWRISDDREDVDEHVLADGVGLGPGQFLLLWADGLPDVGADHLPFSLAADGGEIALYAPDGRGAVVTYGQVEEDFSVARTTDGCVGDGCWTFVYRGTPGATNTPVVTTEVELLPAASTWSYWDAGSAPAGDWTSLGYDASAWGAGPGPLGFGDAQTTVVYGGPDAARSSTVYFRTTVEVTGVATLLELRAELMRDDGAAIHVNGVEAERTNLADGELVYSTLAERSVGSSDETAYFDLELDPALLVEGTNVIAVEVHQASVSSSDLSFDLRLVGTVATR